METLEAASKGTAVRKMGGMGGLESHLGLVGRVEEQIQQQCLFILMQYKPVSDPFPGKQLHRHFLFISPLRYAVSMALVTSSFFFSAVPLFTSPMYQTQPFQIKLSMVQSCGLFCPKLS